MGKHNFFHAVKPQQYLQFYEFFNVRRGGGGLDDKTPHSYSTGCFTDYMFLYLNAYHLLRKNMQNRY